MCIIFQTMGSKAADLNTSWELLSPNLYNFAMEIVWGKNYEEKDVNGRKLY